MNAKRALRLRREVLTELRDGDLEAVAGAAGEGPSWILTWCITCLTCITCPWNCAADPGAAGE